MSDLLRHALERHRGEQNTIVLRATPGNRFPQTGQRRGGLSAGLRAAPDGCGTSDNQPRAPRSASLIPRA
ncbi:hypothetical protein GCM10010109_86330 [Actinoplanes campanulatus]|nr:hypothetical protein GCM10010109_86330 [Actinoplanes campanulatus]GID41759.1 hypothetical protein Aca09nite_82650 [Actinoplanes campanulatus]